MLFSRKLSNHKYVMWLIGSSIISALSLTACANLKNSAPSQEEPLPLEKAISNHESPFSITGADMDIDVTDAYIVDLAEQEDTYTITEAGDYLLFGSLNGSICIDAEEQIVHLILDGASIRSNEGSAISVLSAGKLVLTLNTDTVNYVSDSSKYNTSDQENACIYSVCDLTINGEGTLDIQGYHMDGIHSKDVVKILGGEIHVLAKRDGIRGNDGILVATDQLNIESEKSGLHTTKTTKKTGGDIEITGGDLSIVAGEYAISSIGDFWAYDCNIYTKSILASLSVEGNQTIQEGCMVNE